MKYTTITTLAALLLATSGAIAQTTAYTKPSGFVTHTLKAGQFNLIGLTLHKPVTASGAFTAVSGTTLTDTSKNFTTLLTAGKTYILEIVENNGSTTDDMVGTIQEITAWTATELTTTDDLDADGLLVGAKYQLREAATLETVLGTTDSVLKKGVVPTLADIVWVPNSSGSYDSYYLHTTNVWKRVTGNTPAPNVPLVYSDGFWIQRRGAEISLVLTGSVKTKETSMALQTGFNPISIVSPVGVTLQNSGLADSLQKGVVATLADIVWVPKTGGGYDRYYYHITNVWKNADTNATIGSDIDLPSGVFVMRRNAPTNITLTPPSGYSGL